MRARVDRRLWFAMAVGDEPAKQVNREIKDAAMTAMFDLRDILELIGDGFDDESTTQQELVPKRHQPVFHVGSQSRDELNTLVPQRLSVLDANIAFVTKQFAEEVSGQRQQGFPVVGIARGQSKGQNLSQIVDGEMQLEPEEPAHGGLAALCQSSEHLMPADAFIVTNPKRRGVDEAHARAPSGRAFEISAQGHQRGWNPFHETVIAGQSREFSTPVMEQ